MLERAYDNFIVPLETFRKEQIGAVKERKKKFDKQTAKFCSSQERYLGLSTRKQDTILQEVSSNQYIDGISLRPGKVQKRVLTSQLCSVMILCTPP